MEKLTKSMSLFKERNCSVSIVLDSRTRRKNAYEFPLSLRFTIKRLQILQQRLRINI